ncbi:phenylacetate-CoA oxygenase subunit PaaJ [Microbacterium horticulturae]|uniref:Phenylacetate-CoA oxygenase subunit PaaJ n=1 Tax=Microbacterium horticulturae TaxID=3028316 RepID=A0ABY8C513_9MICO|nr:1,2-phenylacetyl-CoA epoxidase subunit PaaD [Microbacterium sp. KACC 23027]WEG09913.1 phenylacetate-CoA oxygenase subunit PaaJ [Microbacterium sp. KACC 23027]
MVMRAVLPTRAEALEAVLGPAPVVVPADGTDLERARAAASTVCDPELPVLSIADLGVLRDVRIDEDVVTVVVTPTYSGCPMMQVIERDIARAVRAAGFADVHVRTELSPAWTTDWISAEGRRRLEEFGIAPPTGTRPLGPIQGGLHVRCPHCRSLNTREISHYGSTACKALYACRSCGEPFDFFKDH